METTIHIPPLSYTNSSTSQSPFLKLVGSETLCFIELQGVIQKLEPTETRLGKLVQELDGRIFLYVGYQKMEGKLVTLKKPFAVLKRPTQAQALTSTEGDVPQSSQVDASGRNGAGPVHLELVDIVTKKLYFGQRPEPLGTLEHV